MQNQSFVVLVNSTDNFSDSWKAFFTLFKHFWPRPWPKIILNSETLGYEDTELDIYNAKTYDACGKKLTWSESIRYCASLSQKTAILYLQDDYFFTNYVNIKLVFDSAKQVELDSVAGVQLTYTGSVGYHFETADKKFIEFRKTAKYLTSCQATMWNSQALMSLLKDDENAWQFEILGTYRAKKSCLRFMAIPRNRKDQSAISYVARTGIIKGKWNPLVQELFKIHSIDVDFSHRGFYENISFVTNKVNTLKKILENPQVIFNRLIGK